MKRIIQLIIDFLNKLLGYNDNYTNTSTNINIYNYQEKQFMSNYERYFFNILMELEKELSIRIHPQVNLNSIINKIDNTKYRNELFRNIDFAIFDNNYTKVLLLIEINDNTHNTKSRRIRDQKVDKICAKAKIKLIKFYSKYANEKSYVKNRIKQELTKTENQIEKQ